MEEEESRDEHAESESTQGEDQIAPAPVLALGTAFHARAAEGGNVCPGEQTANQLTDRPPNTQHGQHVTGGEGQELEEESAINRQISTNTKTKAGVQSTNTIQG